MSSINYEHIAILGRQPELGLAELESLLGGNRVTPFGKGLAFVDLQNKSIPTTCGSTVKFMHVKGRVESLDWGVIEKALVEFARDLEQNVPEGKLTIGLSAYGLQVSTRQLGHTSLLVKKSVKAKGRSVRLVPNTSIAMNSAQVIHNKLINERGWELCLVRDGQTTVLAQTVWEQPIEWYAARDQARPNRDARVGMLPPKLAQTIVNLAVGDRRGLETVNGKPDAAPTLLDPFCGTGVVLQEAALMGIQVYGTDVDARMIDYTKGNLEWLEDRFRLNPIGATLEVGDATSHGWQSGVDYVATETFLGKPFGANAPRQEIDTQKHAVGGLLKSALKNIARQIESGTRCCFAVPVWQHQNKLIFLGLIDQLPEMGYNLVSFRHCDASALVYIRDDQVVGRQLIVCEKE